MDIYVEHQLNDVCDRNNNNDNKHKNMLWSLTNRFFFDLFYFQRDSRLSKYLGFKSLFINKPSSESDYTIKMMHYSV